MRLVLADLGASTAGEWEAYFDGSDVELNDGGDEDGTIFLTTRGSFSVSGVKGNGADVFFCSPGSLRTNTGCSFGAFWDGSADGFSGEREESRIFLSLTAGE